MYFDSSTTFPIKSNCKLRNHKFEGQKLLGFLHNSYIIQKMTGELSVFTVGTTQVLSIFIIESDFRSTEFSGTLKG